MHRFRFVLYVLIVVLIVVAVVFWLKRNKPIAVTVDEVSLGEVERTVTNTRAGTLNACRRAKLSPSLGGQIARLPVREGEQVKTGQILFEIWNDDLQAQLQLARSELIASQALQRQACIQAELAKRESRRLNELLAQRLASDESADKAEGQARASSVPTINT